MGKKALVRRADFPLHKIFEPENGGLLAGENPTALAFWIRRYLTERVLGVGSPHTGQAKARDLGHFCRFFLEWNQSSAIGHWRRRDTEAFREELLRKGYKPASVNRLLATVKHFGRYCEEKRAFAEECPVAGVKNVPFDAPEPKGLDRSEVHRLFKAVEDLARMKGGWEAARDEAICHLLYATGLRVTELCHLEVKNWDGRWLRGFRTKGGHFRDLYVAAQARAPLEGYLTLRASAIVDLEAKYEGFSGAKRQEVEKTAPWCRPDPRWLFLNRYGSQITRQHVHELLRKVAEHARVHYGAELHLYPHRLRHVFALEKLKKCGDPVLVAQLLGHRSLQHVARYTRRREEEIEEILEG